MKTAALALLSLAAGLIAGIAYFGERFYLFADGKMIYRNGEPVSSPAFQLRMRGNLWCRLMGWDMRNETPIYRGLVSWMSTKGIFVLEFSLGQLTSLLIGFGRPFPFLHIAIDNGPDSFQL